MSARTDKIIAIQKILFPDERDEWDGIIGSKTRLAFQELDDPNSIWHVAKATSFADPEDVKKYRRCRAKGKSEAYCLKYAGDNGIGVWDDDTTSATPACALNQKHIAERWGSLDGGKHKLVDVKIEDMIVTCILKDTGTPASRIDLNPGALSAFGLEAPLSVNAKWKWASQEVVVDSGTKETIEDLTEKLEAGTEKLKDALDSAQQGET